MIAGNPLDRSDKGTIETNARSFACLNYNAPGTPQTPNFPTTNCPDGLRAQVYFPSCWDGVNLDSPDHKSHVAYPTQDYDNGPCPATHPVRIISIFIEVNWHTEQFGAMWYGDQQPFVFSFGDPTGYGLHGDFVSNMVSSSFWNSVTNVICSHLSLTAGTLTFSKTPSTLAMTEAVISPSVSRLPSSPIMLPTAAFSSARLTSRSTVGSMPSQAATQSSLAQMMLNL